MAKGMRINGQVYNIFIEEEYSCANGGQCNCPYKHFASSNSVTSSDSFVEETVVSAGSCEEVLRQREGVERWMTVKAGRGVNRLAETTFIAFP